MHVPLARRWINDFLHFARKVPSVPVARRMDLGPLVEARARLGRRPSWVAIFTKAFSLVAREVAELRRAYLGNLFPRLYEHPVSVASVAIERKYQGEDAVFFGTLLGPDNQTLADLTDYLHRYKTDDLWSMGHFRQLLRISRLPRPLRRVAWWYGLNMDGNRRARRFGTFGVSVYSGLGAESLHPISPLTTLLTYGVISPEGAVDVRLVYDHRVMDGSTVARALARLEEILRSEIVAELTRMRQSEEDRSAA
jgi:hypothetical protein